MKTILVGVLIIIVGVGIFNGLKKSPTPVPAPIETAVNPDSPYLEFSPGVLETTGTQRRVLFFYANWCPTCRPADAELKANQDKIPADVRVIRVNYNDPDTEDSEKTLANKYQVTYQHTFVQIDSAGDPVTRWNGGGFNQLLSNLK